MKLVALLATLAAFALVAFAAPTKPVWPQQFHAVFGLNDGLAFLHNETANFYYNWPVRWHAPARHVPQHTRSMSP